MPRKVLDGAKLAADVARLSGADRLSPPEARPSLMDAVRALATYIETRSRLGWSDRMIAALLTEAGYPIDAATLCSYRKRLRDEGLRAPLIPPLGKPAAGDAPSPDVMPAPAASPAPAPEPEAKPAGTPHAPEEPRSTGAPAAPTTPAPGRRGFVLDRSTLPPDHA